MYQYKTLKAFNFKDDDHLMMRRKKKNMSQYPHLLINNIYKINPFFFFFLVPGITIYNIRIIDDFYEMME